MKASIKTRIRITKTGKIMRRPMGINHSLAKKTGSQRRDKRKMLRIKTMDIAMFKKYFSKSV